MNKSSLLRLSRAFGRGQLTKETYRRRRAELIEARLRQDEDEETVTDHRDRHYPAADSVTVTDRPMADIKARLTRSRPALVAGVAGLIAVGAGLMFLMSGEEASPPEPETTSTPQRTVSRAPVDVLGSYTDEILADETLTDDEIINLVDLWDVSPDSAQQNWLEDTEERLITARENDDDARLRLLENIYYELDVPVPTSGSAAPDVAAADVTKTGQRQTATTRAPDDSASEESDVTTDETRVAAADTAGQERGGVADEEADTATGQADSGIEETGSGPERTASPEESTEEARKVAQQTDAREVATPDAAPDKPTKEPEPAASSTEESAVQESTGTATTVAASEQQEEDQQPEEQQPAGQSEEPDDRIAGVEPSEEMLQQQEQEMTRSGTDLHAALDALHEQELTLDRLSGFTDTWGQATRDEKLAFAITGDKNVFESVKSIARSEYSRYQYGELERDERHTKLRRLNDILGGVIKYRENQARNGLAAITDSGRLEKDDLMSLNGDKYTLQLVGAESEAGVQDYIRRHSTLGNLFYVEVPKDDASWYVVLQGEYSSKNVALLVYDDFPNELKGERPWARSFKSLQALFE